MGYASRANPTAQRARAGALKPASPDKSFDRLERERRDRTLLERTNRQTLMMACGVYVPIQPKRKYQILHIKDDEV